MTRLVIVGNGQAAGALLRQVHRYRRYFSITVLSGSEPLRKPAWYEARGIDLRTGVWVTAVDRHARVVKCSDRSRTTFDWLVLATGRNGLIPAGLEARRGVIVNRSFETSDGLVCALGACAEPRDCAPVPLDAQARILAEHLVRVATGAEFAAGTREATSRKYRVVTLPKIPGAERALTA